MEKWMVYNKKADFQKIGSEFGIDPVIARLIRNRDIQDMKEIRSYLYGTLAEIPSPWKMKDMERAVQILQKKITQKKRSESSEIMIWRDSYLHFVERSETT